MPITYERKAFFDAVRESVFGGRMTATQVSGTDAILKTWEIEQSYGDLRFLAYALGTTKWETASTMQPIEEYGHGRGRAYGVPAGPWHKVYDGRGDVQLTWLANYQKATTRLRAIGALRADEDLAQTPELAMRPDVAAAIMIHGMLEGWFTGRKLADYFHDTATDWVGARRIINGIDHADDIAALARSFFAALKASIVFTANASQIAATAPKAAAPVVAPAISVPAPISAPTAAPPAAPPAAAVPARSLLSRLASFFG